MTLGAILRLAFINLGRNPLRSILTGLGIIIAVGSVITMVGLVEGANISIQGEIARMGTHMLFVMPGSGTIGGNRMAQGSLTTLTEEDAEAIVQDCPSVRLATPWVRTAAQVVTANQNRSTAVIGTNEDFFAIRDWHLERGSFFTHHDLRSAAKVCLLGKTVADHLFGSIDPVGQTVRIRRIPFEVVGVLAERGQTSVGEDQDDRVVVPFPTLQRRMLGITHAHMIMVSAESEDHLPSAKREIEEVLRRRHRLTEDQDSDFMLNTQADLAEMADATLRIIQLLLAAIASVSLLVGGINIMNIMLVSVTERTREIGIRMAVGARRRDILVQFLVEAMTLSALGGGFGIAGGLGLTAGVNRWLTGWDLAWSPLAILASVLFSAAVGVFFGLYPAWKASRLDPIEALRYE